MVDKNKINIYYLLFPCIADILDGALMLALIYYYFLYDVDTEWSQCFKTIFHLSL